MQQIRWEAFKQAVAIRTFLERKALRRARAKDWNLTESEAVITFYPSDNKKLTRIIIHCVTRSGFKDYTHYQETRRKEH
jgi:hypothetical protein